MAVILATMSPPTQALSCVDGSHPRTRHFTGEYPRNLLYWREETTGYPRPSRSRCWFVSERGERRAARCTQTAEGRFLAAPRRMLTPGEWMLSDTRHPRRFEASITIADRVDRAPPTGTLREIRWRDEPDLGVDLLLSLVDVVDDSPVRIEVELESGDEATRFSDALFFDGPPASIERDRRVAGIDPGLRVGLGDTFIAAVKDNPCWSGDQVGLPRFGRGPVTIRLRLVDAAGNATPWKEHTIPGDQRAGALSVTPGSFGRSSPRTP
ncbi:MAG: hypothetical protein ABIO70_12340 [Pseudomonadota bacterium]